jgi:hypothetical protein
MDMGFPESSLLGHFIVDVTKSSVSPLFPVNSPLTKDHTPFSLLQDKLFVVAPGLKFKIYDIHKHKLNSFSLSKEIRYAPICFK